MIYESENCSSYPTNSSHVLVVGVDLPAEAEGSEQLTHELLQPTRWNEAAGIGIEIAPTQYKDGTILSKLLRIDDSEIEVDTHSYSA